jgi:hypothetical protein
MLPNTFRKHLRTEWLRSLDRRASGETHSKVQK